MKFRKSGLLAAAALAVMSMSSSANATLLLIKIDWSEAASGSYQGIETFKIDSFAGFTGPVPNFLYFTTIGNSLGRDTVFFGGPTRADLVGTGDIAPDRIVDQLNLDRFSGLYSGSGLLLSAGPGSSFTGVFGSRLSISAVPEPTTWATSILGLGLIGFSMRRRKETAAKPLLA